MEGVCDATALVTCITSRRLIESQQQALSVLLTCSSAALHSQSSSRIDVLPPTSEANRSTCKVAPHNVFTLALH